MGSTQQLMEKFYDLFNAGDIEGELLLVAVEVVLHLLAHGERPRKGDLGGLARRSDQHVVAVRFPVVCLRIVQCDAA